MTYSLHIILFWLIRVFKLCLWWKPISLDCKTVINKKALLSQRWPRDAPYI